MASPLPTTVRVTILPKLTATIEALDVLSQAFQDIADALLVARDTLQDVEDDTSCPYPVTGCGENPCVCDGAPLTTDVAPNAGSAD